MINVASMVEPGGTPAPLMRTAPDVVSAAGVHDPATLARQQLPNAVPAPSQVAAYAAYMPSAYRPLVRMVSSQLAAQFIAQGETVDGGSLFQIFEPPSTLSTTIAAPQYSYLSDIRLARGQESTATQQSPGNEPINAQGKSQISLSTTETSASTSHAEVERGGVAQLAASLPQLSVIMGRQPGLSNMRGIGAYQLASSRNTASRKGPATKIEAAD